MYSPFKMERTGADAKTPGQGALVNKEVKKTIN